MSFTPKKIYGSGTPGQAPSSGSELVKNFNDNFDSVKSDLEEKDKKIGQLEQDGNWGVPMAFAKINSISSEADLRCQEMALTAFYNRDVPEGSNSQYIDIVIGSKTYAYRAQTLYKRNGREVITLEADKDKIYLDMSWNGNGATSADRYPMKNDIVIKFNPGDVYDALDKTIGLINYKTGFYIHKSHGLEASDTSGSLKASDFYLLAKNNDIVVRGKQSNNAAFCCFYDSKQKFIGSYNLPIEEQAQTIEKTITWREIEELYPNAVYARSSAASNDTRANICIVGISLQKTYQSAYENVNRLERSLKNPTTFIEGYYRHVAHGDLVKSEGYKSSKMYLLTRNSDLRIINARQHANAAFCCFYDSNQKFVGRFTLNSDRTESRTITWAEIESISTAALYASITASVNDEDAAIFSQSSNTEDNQSLVQLLGDFKKDITGLSSVNYNVSLAFNKNFLTKEEARRNVPENIRTKGLILSYFLGSENFVREEYTPNSSLFEAATNWKEEILIEEVYNDKYIYAIVDENNKLLFGVDKNGETFTLDDTKPYTIEHGDYVYAIVDEDSKLLFGITKQGKIYYDGVSSSGNSGSGGYFSNNLRNQSKTISTLKGAYSFENTIYEIPIVSSLCRVAFDFSINEALNDSIGRKTIAEIHIGSAIHDIKTISALPEQLFRVYDQDPRKNSALLQHEKLNSGFEIIGNDHVRDSLMFEPMIGDPIFSIWLKGEHKAISDFIDTNTATGNNYLSDRERWLSDNRDFAIVIENDIFSIIRDGLDVGVVPTPFNNGNTSVIYATSLKDGQGNYKTLKSFYEEIKSENEPGKKLADFYINHYKVSSRNTCEDIAQFGKIKLVGKYFQQIENITGGYHIDHGDHYDSYPFLVRMKKDTKKHTCEIVLVNDILYAQIDGVMYYKNVEPLSTLDKVVIGGTASTISGNITCSDLEVWIGSIGEAEIKNNARLSTIASKRSPYTVGLMGHYLVDTMEGNAFNTSGLGQSLSRMEDVCSLLRDRKYNVLGLEEIKRMLKNSAQTTAKNAFFVFDDRRVENLYEDKRNRQSLSKYGFPVILASVMVGEYENAPDKYFRLFTSMRNNEWYNMSHSYFHNIPYCEKNSIILFAEVNKMIEVADSLNMFNHSITYAFSAGWEVTHNIFSMLGYSFAILNNAPYYSIKARNKYMIARVNMADDASFETLKDYLF